MPPQDTDTKLACSRFTLKDYDVIGFDLDHTLARYRLPALYRLCYTSIVKHLIDIGYPKEIFSDFDESQLAFCQKGLLYDKEKGNFLKLGVDRNILLCYHGTKRLSNEAIQKIYGAESEEAATLKHMPFIRGETSEKVTRFFHCFGDYFTVGTIYLLMKIVDAKDAGKIASQDYAKPYRDFFEGYSKMYSRENFQEHTGYFFPEVKTNTSKMLYQCTPKMLEWLKQLRFDGMKIVVITSSNADYAEMMLRYCIGNNWMDYFDSVVTWARKPGFWTQPERMFYTVKNNREGDMIGSLKDKTVYAQGSCNKLNQLLKQLTGKDQPKMVYVGDSLVDDIYVPTKYDCCDTIGIVEEIELEKMPGWSSNWGSFFYANEPIESPSFWSSVISSSCKLAVPSVEEMAQYPRDHVFEKCTDSCLVFT